MKIAKRQSDLVGNTPLVYIDKIAGPSCVGRIICKLESLGPCSSVKDRLGKSMIDHAEENGLLQPGWTIVEPTSGNTGIALAAIARERGYKCIITMPETMSLERRMMLLSLGAEVVLTPAASAINGSIAKAYEILKGLDGKGYMPLQFENIANAKIHRETTGPEIWRDTEGEIDIFVAGIGTGGTFTGCAQYIKGCKKVGEPGVKPAVKFIAVEPREQMLITAAMGGEKIGPQGPHKIAGIGSGIVPKVLDLDLIDEVVPVHSDDAMAMCNRMWLEEGIPVGISAGAAVHAAKLVMEKPENAGKNCVVIIASFGERYFSHPAFDTIKATASALTREPLPEPFDNTLYGFATARG